MYGRHPVQRMSRQRAGGGDGEPETAAGLRLSEVVPW